MYTAKFSILRSPHIWLSHLTWQMFNCLYLGYWQVGYCKLKTIGEQSLCCYVSVMFFNMFHIHLKWFAKRPLSWLIEAEWRIYASVQITTLVQIMACRLIGAKPLSEPMLDYCQLDPCEHISVKILSKCNNFHWRKCTLKCRLGNGVHLVSASMC